MKDAWLDTNSMPTGTTSHQGDQIFSSLAPELITPPRDLQECAVAESYSA
jgi:hypothetical protein